MGATRKGEYLTPKEKTKIRELRDYGMTQAALGKRFGVDRATIAVALKERP
jgi:DNA-binding XRE family transcriptional regulator